MAVRLAWELMPAPVLLLDGASLWFRSYADGVKAPVVLRATNIAALDHVPEDALVDCAADAPDDASELLD